MFRRERILFILILTFGFVTSYNATVLAEDVDQQKYYVGLKTPYVWIDGDFDSEPDSPGLEESLGISLFFGATKDFYSCEFSYSQSEHKVYLIPKSNAKLETLDISIKVSPSSFKNRRLRPYGLIGWGINNLSIENLDVDLETVKYEGAGFHLGFGVNCKFNRKIAIDGSVAYYRYGIDKIKQGPNYELYEPPKDDVMLIDTVVSFGIQYYF